MYSHQNLYNLYTEKIFREIEGMPGVVIGEVNINNLRYADDTGLLAIDSGKLQDLMNTVNEKAKEYGMIINIKKTKVMVVNVSWAGQRIHTRKYSICN